MPHAPDLSGHALDDRYELHAVIGEGTFGCVYSGVDRRLARPVAVKVIKPWWTEDPEWVATFEREAQLLARVSDPGIVQIYDVGHAPEGLYYVSELVEGESLHERLRREPVPAWGAAAIAAQLCRALARAHGQRIVHRDVKPANILLSTEGRVKIGDFGIARLAEATTDGEGGTIVGTPRYMAPEQGRGLPTTPATDVYSVGVVLYEMLAGQPPFTGVSAVQLALGHLQDAPPPLGDAVPAELAEIVGRALAKDPERRFADAGEMADALERVRRRRGLRAPARARTRTASHAPAREPVAVGAGNGAPGGGGALGDGGAGGAAVADGGPPDRPPTARTRPLGAPPRRPDDTRPAPQRSARHDVNPPARRRALAALGLAFALLAAMAAAAVLLGQHSTARTGRHRAPARHVAAAPPVSVPLLVGENASDAQAKLRQIGLRASLQYAPAPGIRAGTVTSQTPTAGRGARRSSAVRLSVAEAPRWRPLTTFTGGESVIFRIRGDHWRIVYTMANERSCHLLIFCSDSHAQVLDAHSGATLHTFGLADGDGHSEVVRTAPGLYRVSVSPASNRAHWSMEIQDWY